jgi:hypothetical protein
VSYRRLCSENTLPVGTYGYVSQSERERQLRQEATGDTHLNIDFEVTVFSATDLQASVSTLQGENLRRYELRSTCLYHTHSPRLCCSPNEWLDNFGGCAGRQRSHHTSIECSCHDGEIQGDSDVTLQTITGESYVEALTSKNISFM